MKPEAEIQANLQRANASIQAARTLLHNDYPDFAALRAYYAALKAIVVAEKFIQAVLDIVEAEQTDI